MARTSRGTWDGPTCRSHGCRGCLQEGPDGGLRRQQGLNLSLCLIKQGCPDAALTHPRRCPPGSDDPKPRKRAEELLAEIRPSSVDRVVLGIDEDFMMGMQRMLNEWAPRGRGGSPSSRISYLSGTS
ncbi:hypothetical protein MLD38_012395 [Melastoma candidum]|uniref:Uncharacterized protein n=1 Tax=Melastoma candidum TaxID=119954 RepID=A0ACB9R796_9MYRT|nr:hypothetical protein MLD38_012395 [Melastoma candidum]